MADRITLDSGIQIVDGSIVILARFPGTKWVVHKGWYAYQENQYNGWYLSSIPSQTTMPLLDSDLIGIVVVGGECSCPDQPFPSPCPPRPGGGGMSPEMTWELNRAWITVDTLEQLSRLNRRLVPDGKIVRVNDTGDGIAKYYRYDQAKSIWTEEYFGIDTTNFVSKDDLVQEVKDQLDNVDFSQTVVNVIKENDEVHQTIKEVAESDTTWKELSEE